MLPLILERRGRHNFVSIELVRESSMQPACQFNTCSHALMQNANVQVCCHHYGD